MNTKTRKIYALLFAVLMLTEIFIAIFIKGGFVRAYLGDVFITLLICFFVQSIFKKRIRFLTVCVFAFSVVVEICQYFDLVKLLGLEDCRLVSVWFGRSFSFYDIICYAVGCLIFAFVDFALCRGKEA